MMVIKTFMVTLVIFIACIAIMIPAWAGIGTVFNDGNYLYYHDSEGNTGTGYWVGDWFYYHDNTGKSITMYPIGDTWHIYSHEPTGAISSGELGLQNRHYKRYKVEDEPFERLKEGLKKEVAEVAQKYAIQPQATSEQTVLPAVQNTAKRGLKEIWFYSLGSFLVGLLVACIIIQKRKLA